MKQFVTSTTPVLETVSGPGLCVRCGKCEKQCPQHLPIMQNLAEVRKRMEPLWFRWMTFLIRKAMGKGGKRAGGPSA
jgi:L-lactate utilization protein LutB